MADTPGGLQTALKIFSTNAAQLAQPAQRLRPVVSPIITSVRVRPRQNSTRITSPLMASSSPLNAAAGATDHAALNAAAGSTYHAALTPPTSPIVGVDSTTDQPFPIFQYVTSQIRRELKRNMGLEGVVQDTATITHTVSFCHDSTMWSSDIILPPRASLSALSSKVIPGLFPNGVPENMSFGEGFFEFYFLWRDTTTGNILPGDYLLLFPHILLGELHVHLPP
jgi:hypothetical protein